MSFVQKLQMLGGIMVLCLFWTGVYLLWAYMTLIVSLIGVLLGTSLFTAYVIWIAHRVQPLFDARHARRIEDQRIQIEREQVALQRERQTYELTIQQEQHQTTVALQIREFELRTHLLLTQVRPDEKGHYPYIKDPDGGYLHLPNPHLRALPSTRVSPADEDGETVAPKQLLPGSVRYADVRSLIPRGHTCLGMSEAGLETRPFSVLCTMWIVGGSKTGKTTTVSLKVNEAYEQGCFFWVIDPHRYKADSLTNAIRGYSKRFLDPGIATTPEHILAVLKSFLREAQARMGGTSQNRTPIILLMDEIGHICDLNGLEGDELAQAQEIVGMVKRISRMCGQELRGFNMFGWFISQTPIGLAWLRRNAMTVIAHKILQMSDRKIACNEMMDVARDMDKWPIGRVVVYGLDISSDGEYLITQMPQFTPQIVDADPVSAGAQNISFLRSVPQKKDDECFEDDGIEPLPMRPEQVPSEALGTTMSTGAPEQVPAKSTDEKQFTPEQEREFLRLYGIHKSIRKAILSMGISYGRYQKCASQLVERKLRKA